MTAAPNVDLTVCDREPIHIPGSVQPHGVMLIANPDTLAVTHAAGDIETWLGQADWRGKPLAYLLGEAVAAALPRIIASKTRTSLERIAPPAAAARILQAAAHLSGGHLIVELEAAPPAGFSSALLLQLESAAAALERAPNLQQLCETAAVAFRSLTGYDRVMVYRFLEDDAGVVVAEQTAPGQHSFLHHHFPASDIPKQARALYVRNLVRVIPDVAYTPMPLRPAWTNATPLDMSDCDLRSVSPVHIQYLKNMGVAASASISIVKDGALWGLIACHNQTPRAIPADIRSACRALAGGLSRQIKAREETDTYRERVRLRSYEDDIVALLSREGTLDQAISKHLTDIMQMLDGDGVAILRGSDLVMTGRTPPEAELRKLATWAIDKSDKSVFSTQSLTKSYPLPEAYRGVAAGLLAVTLTTSDPWIVLWFRSEEVEIVNWAGNPHKSTEPAAGGTLNPRASFAAWTETVRGHSRRWTLAEIEAAARLREAVVNVWQTRRISELNRQLLNTLNEKDLLIKQKEFLLGEVNHRVQNSLQLVSGFLALQARDSTDPALNAAIEEARRRISAVSLVHRRLYRSERLEAIDAARYVEELLADMTSAMGADWQRQLSRDLQPVMLPNDRAIVLGLVLTELVINAQKHAYGGAPGPLGIILAEDRNLVRLVVTDQGVGTALPRKGYGSRMMQALVSQIGGTLDYESANPGTRATLTAPVEAPRH